MSQASCDVYRARAACLRPAHGELLDSVERGRLATYRLARASSLFTLGAALLRVVAGRRTGVAPEEVRIDRTCPRCGDPHGRPRIAGLHVSVSHSGDLAAVAVTSAGPVGLDVEQVRPLEHAPLARKIRPAGDHEPIGELEAFYVTWTRKESVLKATGVGLDLAMAKVRVTPPDEPPRLLGYAGDAPMPAQMADTSPGEGYAGAVTVLTPTPVSFHAQDARRLLEAV